MNPYPFLPLLLAGTLAAGDNPHLDFAVGVLEEMRETGKAAKRFEDARLADPLALPLVDTAVKARLAEGDRAGAAKLYRDLASARPDDLIVQLIFADFLEAQGRGDSMAAKLATDALLSVLKTHPGNPQIIQRLHHLYQSMEKPAEAAALLSQLSPEDPESAILYASLTKSTSDAKDAAQRDRLDEHYQTALAANPENPTLARDASEHFRNTGRLDMAIDVLKRHVAAAPSSLELRTRLGVLHFSAGHPDEGVAVLTEVLTINPQQALAHQSLAKFCRSHDQPELARVHAGELLKIQGGSPADFMKLAEEWMTAGNPKEARLLLERAVFDHPGEWEIGQKLAIASRQDPETRQAAAALFRQAETTRPADAKPQPAFLVEFAETLLAEGQSKPAEDQLRNAIRAFPPEAKKETAAALRRLASIWQKENRNADAARALLQRADSLDR